jgi:energy-coupling factor transporter ATP-binding protein EcfA2
MWLSRITIKNFRNFKLLDVKLGEHAVVLGENKVGKTNLLFALRLILDPITEGRVHENRVARSLRFEPGTIVVFRSWLRRLRLVRFPRCRGRVFRHAPARHGALLWMLWNFKSQLRRIDRWWGR